MSLTYHGSDRLRVKAVSDNRSTPIMWAVTLKWEGSTPEVTTRRSRRLVYSLMPLASSSAAPVMAMGAHDHECTLPDPWSFAILYVPTINRGSPLAYLR